MQQSREAVVQSWAWTQDGTSHLVVQSDLEVPYCCTWSDEPLLQQLHVGAQGPTAGQKVWYWPSQMCNQ